MRRMRGEPAAGQVGPPKPKKLALRDWWMRSQENARNSRMMQKYASSEDNEMEPAVVVRSPKPRVRRIPYRDISGD